MRAQVRNPFDGELGGIPRLRVDQDLVAGAAYRHRNSPVTLLEAEDGGRPILSWERGVQTADEFLQALAHVHVHAAHEIHHGAMEESKHPVALMLALAHTQLAQSLLLEVFANQAASEFSEVAAQIHWGAGFLSTTMTKVVRRVVP